MTLDEAIKHAEEVAEENEKFCYKKGGKGGYFNEDTDWNNTRCAEEHRQLAEWLKDYKRLLGQKYCEDAISRSEAIRVASGFCHFANIANELAKLPSVSTEKIGHWIFDIESPEWSFQFPYRCSNCGARSVISHFCPNCGEKKIKPQESEGKG